MGSGTPNTAARQVLRYGYLLCLFAVALGVLHFVWPAHTWGQGRKSFFFLGNSLTLASWLTSMVILCGALCCVAVFLRAADPDTKNPRWPWLAAIPFLLFLSFSEITRLPGRLGWLVRDSTAAAGQVDALLLLAGPGHLLCAALLLLGGYGYWLLRQCRRRAVVSRCIVLWLALWFVAAVSRLLPWGGWLDLSSSWLALVRGESYLLGAVFLAVVLGMLAVQPPEAAIAARSGGGETAGLRALATPRGRTLFLFAVGGTTAVLICFQITLFQVLLIFGDYLNASAAISIALLGLAAGGIVGFRCHRVAPFAAIMVAAALLPVAILLAAGAAYASTAAPLLAALLLAFPFLCGGVVITLSLSLGASHVVYCADLIGAGLGALAVGPLISHWREETTLLVLSAAAATVACCFLVLGTEGRKRLGACLAGVAVAGLFLWLGQVNLQRDTINLGRARLQARWPSSQVLFSRSSLAGRIDIVRRTPESRYLKTYENGRTIDTIRPFADSAYTVDPRIPHTLISDPDILIIGLAGEGIAKSAKSIGGRVWGVEINPALAGLMRKELVDFARDPYGGVDVAVMDGRSYLEQTDRTFDYITLMNSHQARGDIRGRVANPEYLQTVEAFASYFDHLTNRGYVILEEQAGKPANEPSIWKTLVTIRAALERRGVEHPERHFLVFQWVTKRNRYIQILAKKSPVTAGDKANFRQWLADCDHVGELAGKAGRRLGPIHNLTTTVLYVPGESFRNNFALAVRGEFAPDMVRGHNLIPTTDSQPFPFYTDTARPALGRAYSTTMVLALAFFLTLGLFAGRRWARPGRALPFLLVAVLTGVAYLLIEVALMQQYERYLGSPAVAFAVVLGTLLVFSGLGSLSSGRLGWLTAGMAALGIPVLAILLHLTGPQLAARTAAYPASLRVLLAVVSLAPLAFLMGVPFALVLRLAKVGSSSAATAVLYAVNGAAGALAVPLALDLSTAHGFPATIAAALVAYGCVAVGFLSMHRPRAMSFGNSLAATAALCLLLFPWIQRAAYRKPPAAQLGRYEVLAVRYGRSSYGYDKLVRGGAREKVNFGWYAWLVRGGGHTVLVDTGFRSPTLARLRGVERFTPSDERLRKLGVDPEEISDVILTHFHWDHAGNLGPYSRATVWIQKREYDYAVRLLRPERPARAGMRYADLVRLQRAQASGRVRLVAGSETIYAGLTVQLGGAHTPGSQYVVVNTDSGRIVLAGDSAYLYENIFHRRPIGTTVDHADNLLDLGRMLREAASPSMIVPGHDPRVLQYFPRVGPDVVRLSAWS